MAQEYDLGLVKGETGERGPEGPAGQRGPTGLTPNITIGNVETLAPGSPATVTRRSDSPDEAPVFDFSPGVFLTKAFYSQVVFIRAHKVGILLFVLLSVKLFNKTL